MVLKPWLFLDSVDINRIVISDKFKHSDEKDDVIKPLCIMFPQMSEFIKYFHDGGKNMSFMII